MLLDVVIYYGEKKSLIAQKKAHSFIHVHAVLHTCMVTAHFVEFLAIFFIESFRMVAIKNLYSEERKKIPV